MKFSNNFQALGLLSLLALSAINAEVNAATREQVDVDAVYSLGKHQSWETTCVREKTDRDDCFVGSSIAKPNAIRFDVFSLPVQKRGTNADVDVVDVGNLVIASASDEKIDKALYVSVDALDGMPFDGFMCSLADPSKCLRGPGFDKEDWQHFLEARSATIGFYTKTVPPKKNRKDPAQEDFVLEKVDSVELSLLGLSSAINAGEAHMAKLQHLPEYAQPLAVASCVINNQGSEKRISHTNDVHTVDNRTSLRETLLGPKGSGDCPSYVALAYLTPGMTNSQRGMFCLNYDKKTKSYLGVSRGERNAYGLCKATSKTFCERVKTGKDKAVAVASLASGLVGGASVGAAATGTSVVMHSSGAAILTGSAGYLAGTLGAISTVVLGVLTAPATVAAATVSVIAVGSSVYICK